MLKIFTLTWTKQDETEWIAAKSIIHALQVYSSITGTDLTDFESDDEITEVPREKWAELSVRNNDYDPEDPEDWQCKTFEEWMDGRTEPDIIAGTMYS